MKVALVRCPRTDPSGLSEPRESLALAYLCSALRESGFEVSTLDALLFGLRGEEVVEQILIEKCDLVGFTIPDPTFVKSTVSCIKRIKQEDVSTHITVGGITPTFHYKDIFCVCPEIDSIVMFEGEETICELARLLGDNKNWEKIDGIAYKNGDRISANKPRSLIRNLDAIPFPTRYALPYLIEKNRDSAAISLLSSRGCYGDCSFCAIRSFYSIPKGPSFRFRSINNIVDEIESLVSAYDINEFLFVDDLFIGRGEKSKKRMFQFAKELECRNLNIMFSISDRVDNVNYDILNRLKDVGLRQMFLGLESASQRILNGFNKSVKVQDIEKAIKILEDLGVDIEVSLINFTPDNTVEEIERNLDFFSDMNLNILPGLLNRLKPYGGSEIFEQLRKHGRLTGTFPFFSYQNYKDPRVDLLYGIAKDCLGVFLPVSYKIKELKRRMRRKLFEAYNERKSYNLVKLQSLNEKLYCLQKTIMIEANSIFCEAVNFVKRSSGDCGLCVEDFKKTFVKKSILESRDWLNLLMFYDKFCLNYGLEEYYADEKWHASNSRLEQG